MRSRIALPLLLAPALLALQDQGAAHADPPPTASTAPASQPAALQPAALQPAATLPPSALDAHAVQPATAVTGIERRETVDRRWL